MTRQRAFLVLLTVTAVIVFIYQMQMSQDKIQTPSENQSEESELLKIVKDLKTPKKPLLVTVINEAFVPFAHSWLCNTVFMGVHEHLLIIVTDTKLLEEFSHNWPSIPVIVLPGDHPFGNLDPIHVGYLRIMAKRTEFLLKLLKLKVEIFLFELDAFWLTNPVPETQTQVEGYDIAVVPVSKKPGLICGGFLYMKPTGKMISLWTKLTEMMQSLEKKIKGLDAKKKISQDDNDQVYLSGLIAKQYEGIRVTHMSLDKFPDGQWYTMKEKERTMSSPLVIQNNLLAGNNAKIDRAKRFKHWFWDTEALKCDIALVQEKTRS